MLSVAARAGVSDATVSRVLSGSKSVSASTRERVLAAVEELNYRPNGLARRLRRGRTEAIGVIVPFSMSPSAVERLRGVVAGLEGTDYDLVLFDVQAPEHRLKTFAHVAQPDRVDGILLVSLPPREEELELVRRAGLPLVLVDAEHPAAPRVVIDDAHGGALAAEHLIALGHRRIAFVGDVLPSPFGFPRTRFAGFARALAAAGIELPTELIREGPHGREVARALARELLALQAPPTAIFAASDTQAVGVLAAARERGLAVPRDLSVIGFDDVEPAELVGLTTVRQPLWASGRRGVELLLGSLEDPREPEEEVLPLEVVVRRTTSRPGQAGPASSTTTPS